MNENLKIELSIDSLYGLTVTLIQELEYEDKVISSSSIPLYILKKYFEVTELNDYR